jgi:hypothetical protein
MGRSFFSWLLLTLLALLELSQQQCAQQFLIPNVLKGTVGVRQTW